MTQCKLYTCAAAVAAAVNKERSPMGADVVFTDTGRQHATRTEAQLWINSNGKLPGLSLIHI